MLEMLGLNSAEWDWKPQLCVVRVNAMLAFYPKWFSLAKVW